MVASADTRASQPEGPPPTSRRYGGKTAGERQAERREKLLDAGLELFGTSGFASTTIELLCAQAHLNARYFYAEFKTKEGLLQAVYDRHVESVFKLVVEAVVAAPEDPRSRLESGLRAFIEATLADPRAARINYFEIVGVSHALEARRRSVLRTYAELVATQIEAIEPSITPAGIDLHMVAVAVVSATDGLIIDWISDPTPGDREQIIATLTELFTRAIM